MAPSVIARIAASGDALQPGGAFLLQEQRLADLARVHLPDRRQLRLRGGNTGAMLEGRQPAWDGKTSCGPPILMMQAS